MKKKRIIFFVILGAAVLCMTAIFVFSSQDAVSSDTLSRAVTYRLARILFHFYDTLDSGTQETIIFQLNIFTRKLAHFTVFFLMGSFSNALISLLSDKYVRNGIISTACCFAYACLDELHQSFTPGRTPLVKDVIIDTVGGLLGAVLCFAVICVIRYFRTRNNSSPPSAS